LLGCKRLAGMEDDVHQVRQSDLSYHFWQVDLFDKGGKKVDLQASNLSLHGSVSVDTGPTDPLSRIINGIVNTTRDRHMWLCSLPAAADTPLEIVIQVPSPDLVLGHVRVWNYNRSINDIAKGVKEVQIYLDGDLVWQGVIAKGCGNQVFDYSTRIPLLDESPAAGTGASSTRIHAACVLQEDHFKTSMPEAKCKVHKREAPGCPPTSVGTSFTFSPIDGSSSPSLCGIFSCNSSESGTKQLPKSPSSVQEGQNKDFSDEAFVNQGVEEARSLNRVHSCTGSEKLWSNEVGGERCLATNLGCCSFITHYVFRFF
jgi:hypothetical protein